MTFLADPVYFLGQTWLIRYLRPLNCTRSGDWLSLEQSKEVLSHKNNLRSTASLHPWRRNSGYFITNTFHRWNEPNPMTQFSKYTSWWLVRVFIQILGKVYLSKSHKSLINPGCVSGNTTTTTKQQHILYIVQKERLCNFFWYDYKILKS